MHLYGAEINNITFLECYEQGMKSLPPWNAHVCFTVGQLDGTNILILA